VLLREILVPFFAGLVLAYLFNPLANRLERLGLNRLLAALLIIGAFITAFVALVSLTAPIIARESYFLGVSDGRSFAGDPRQNKGSGISKPVTNFRERDAAPAPLPSLERFSRGLQCAVCALKQTTR
jgi:hypothetical protein